MNYIIDNLMHIGIMDIIDIAIIAFLFYSFMRLVEETRAQQLIKGFVIIVIFWRISAFIGLRMVDFFIENMMRLGFLALIIVFQPELRRALEFIGRNRLFSSGNRDVLNEDTEKLIEEVAEAAEYLSSKKIGALIVIERSTGLADIVSAGTALDAKVSCSLLKSIFPTTSPLHDGAVLIKGNRIVKAGGVLPLTNKSSLGDNLGTRHRAALGLIEQSDAIVLVVSEETGTISIAIDDKLRRYLDKNTIVSILRSKFKVLDSSKDFLNFLKGGSDSEETN